MKKSLVVLAAACMGAAMAGCAGSKKVVDVATLDGEWNIVEVAGQKITADELPFIGLNSEGKRVYGNAGCNRIMGSYEADAQKPGAIQFKQLGATRMMCPDMKTEQLVLGTLDKVEGCVFTETGIALTDAKGEEIVLLEKRELPAAAEVTIETLAGKWNITEVNGAAVEVPQDAVAPFLEFNLEEKRVSGNGSCNVINGGFSQEEGKPSSLKFTQFISTMMAGPGLEQEGKVLKAIGEVASFEVNADGSVSLLNEAGDKVLKLVKE